MIEDNNFIEDLIKEEEQPFLAFDIETSKADLPDYIENFFLNIKQDSRLKDEAKIAINREKIKDQFGLSPQTGKIVLVGFIGNIKLTEDAEQRDGNYYYSFMGEEKDILKGTFDLLHNAYKKNTLLVSYNGKAFDIPFLFLRALVNGVEVKTTYPYSELIAKYKANPHFDLFVNFFSEGKLSTWSYLLGMSDNIYPEGGEIGRWIEKGEIERVIEKNYKDILEVANLYRKIKYLF